MFQTIIVLCIILDSFKKQISFTGLKILKTKLKKYILKICKTKHSVSK